MNETQNHEVGAQVLRVLIADADRHVSLERERAVTHQAFPDPNDPAHSMIDASVNLQHRIVSGMTDRQVLETLPPNSTIE